LYLPGGYPEFYLETLSQNTSMRNAINSFAMDDGNIIAECGGMMYLGKELIDDKEKAHAMCGVFDFTATMMDMKLALGYRNIHLGEAIIKGHEFHYSKIVDGHDALSIGKVINARNMELETKIYRFKNVWASYIHCYLGTEERLKVVLNEIMRDRR